MSITKKIDWILSNQPLAKAEWPCQAGWRGIHCGSRSPFPAGIDTGTIVILDGYAIPRLGSVGRKEAFPGEKIQFANTAEMSRSIKGHFTLAWTGPDGITLCVDHHGMAKVFYAQTAQKWWVSNSLLHLVRALTPSHDEIGIALFNLFEHFIWGRTLFQNIRYSQPAAVLQLTEEKIVAGTHWDPLQRIDGPRTYSDMLDWREFWKKLIASYLSEITFKDPLLTLTGGNDSRLILAALLASGAKPVTFTFGNPLSHDSAIASEISRLLGLDHHNHHVDQPTDSWFHGCAEEIVRKGNGMVNIHRSHRLDAIKKETLASNGPDTVFAGFMGGDYLKGLSYDDYITAKLMRLWSKGRSNKKNHFENVLNEKFLRLSKHQSECLLEEVFPSFEFFNDKLPLPIRELSYLFQIVGSNHDYQDATVFSWEISNVSNPFMDVDFLERLWSSPYSSLNYRARIKGSASRAYFECKLTHLLAPELSPIPYAKWGGYTVQELMQHPFAFKIRRGIRHYFKKKHYPANFPYGKWFYPYCRRELNNLPDEIGSFYQMKQLLQRLEERKTAKTEREWHFASNPINLSLNYQYFKGNA